MGQVSFWSVVYVCIMVEETIFTAKKETFELYSTLVRRLAERLLREN
jgi:hypothetical protein